MSMTVERVCPHCGRPVTWRYSGSATRGYEQPLCEKHAALSGWVVRANGRAIALCTHDAIELIDRAERFYRELLDDVEAGRRVRRLKRSRAWKRTRTLRTARARCA